MPDIKLTQDTHLFTGALADNLRLVDPSATDAALESALDAVEAGWFRALPAGLNTPADEADLDHAHLQQLALAGVLLADPPVVVLDEATAHAGASTTLDTAVARATSGRTAVIVAHRFSQAATADRVVLMERGLVASTD